MNKSTIIETIESSETLKSLLIANKACHVAGLAYDCGSAVSNCVCRIFGIHSVQYKAIGVNWGGNANYVDDLAMMLFEIVGMNDDELG